MAGFPARRTLPDAPISGEAGGKLPSMNRALISATKRSSWLRMWLLKSRRSTLSAFRLLSPGNDDFRTLRTSSPPEIRKRTVGSNKEMRLKMQPSDPETIPGMGRSMDSSGAVRLSAIPLMNWLAAVAARLSPVALIHQGGTSEKEKKANQQKGQQGGMDKRRWSPRVKT